MLHQNSAFKTQGGLNLVRYLTMFLSLSRLRRATMFGFLVAN